MLFSFIPHSSHASCYSLPTLPTSCIQTTCDSLKPCNLYYHRGMSLKTHVNSSGGVEFKASLSRREEASAAGDFSVAVGIDEAGRGPLCGPVVAAACIVLQDEYPDIEGIVDSKKLTDEDQRERTYEKLVSDKRVMWCACIVTNHEIDSINILQASLAAMRRATEGLFEKYHLTDTSKFVALIDGNKIPENMPIASKAIIKGDGHIFSIAAASIIAKVTRDRIMIDLNKIYPQYGLAKHKGYPTASHRQALYDHGPCEIYRMSYKPVKIAFERHQELKKEHKNVPIIEKSENRRRKKSAKENAAVKLEDSKDLKTARIGKRGSSSERKDVSDAVLKKCRINLKGKSTSEKANHETNLTHLIGLRRSARLTIKQ